MPVGAALLQIPTLGGDLARVEKALNTAVCAEDVFLTEVAQHLMAAGGKRLRPALALAAANVTGDAGSPVSDDVIQGAASVELVHLGSLYHDDVMDEADTRRGVDTVNARWGNFVAILGGDYLLARASSIAAALGTEPAGLLASTIASLCEGQVGELSRVYDVTRSEESYLTAIASKTAALMATSCRIGALVAGHDRRVVDALTTFGDRIGIAFQIVDDILDVVASDEQLGKPAGNDLRTGVYTLPVIRALENDEDAQLRALLGRPLETAGMVAARDLVRSDGAVAASLSVARTYVAAATAALDSLDDGVAVDALRAFGDELVGSVSTLS